MINVISKVSSKDQIEIQKSGLDYVESLDDGKCPITSYEKKVLKGDGSKLSVN